MSLACVSLTCTLLLPLCLVLSTVGWAHKSKQWPVLPVVPRLPADYSRVQFPQNPTHSPWEALKRPESVLSFKTTAAAPCVCWQIPWKGSHWHTSHSVPVKWLEAENCTRSDPFRLDLSLKNKQFPSERLAFLHTSAGKMHFLSTSALAALLQNTAVEGVLSQHWTVLWRCRNR